MRLQLTRGCAAVTAVVAGLLALRAHAEDRVAVRADTYTDNWIVVISPASSASVDVGERLTVEGGFAIDVLSGATQVFTTDAITAATYFEETRRDAHMSLSVTPATGWTIDGAYAASIEPDHDAHAGTVSSGVELLDRRATLTAGYTFVHERVGIAGDPHYDQFTLGHLVDVSWAHVVARRTLLTALLTGHHTDCDPDLGCQANPYRLVALVDDGGDVVTTPRERHPDRRIRGAAALRLAQLLGHNLGLHAGYRLYADTWKITGHTGDLGLAKGLFGEQLLLRVEGRFTWQSGASFYRDAYTTDPTDVEVPDVRTGDRELSRMANVTGALRAETTLPPLGPVLPRLNARVAHTYYRYFNFRELPTRNAWLVGVGLGIEY